MNQYPELKMASFASISQCKELLKPIDIPFCPLGVYVYISTYCWAIYFCVIVCGWVVLKMKLAHTLCP